MNNSAILQRFWLIFKYIRLKQKTGKACEVMRLPLPVINSSSLKVVFEDHRTYASPATVSWLLFFSFVFSLSVHKSVLLIWKNKLDFNVVLSVCCWHGWVSRAVEPTYCACHNLMPSFLGPPFFDLLRVAQGWWWQNLFALALYV